MISSLLNDILDLLFPRVCLVCGRGTSTQEQSICLICLGHLPVNRPGHPDFPQWQYRFAGRFPLVWYFPLFDFNADQRIRQIIWLLKYQNAPEIGEQLGEVLGGQIAAGPLAFPDCIIPVPLHPDREKRRGYNQSRHIAMGLAKKLDLPIMDDVLVRKYHTTTQTRRSQFQRIQNVSGAFALKNPCSYQQILLVDDVVTTGATIEQCALTLGNEHRFCIGSLAMA